MPEDSPDYAALEALAENAEQGGHAIPFRVGYYIQIETTELRALITKAREADALRARVVELEKAIRDGCGKSVCRAARLLAKPEDKT